MSLMQHSWSCTWVNSSLASVMWLRLTLDGSNAALLLSNCGKVGFTLGGRSLDRKLHRGKRQNEQYRGKEDTSFMLQPNCKGRTSLPCASSRWKSLLQAQCFSIIRTHVLIAEFLPCNFSSFVLFRVWRQHSWAAVLYPTELCTCHSMLMLLIWGCEVKRACEILTLVLNLMWELMLS